MNVSEPKVFVITPTLNSGRFIADDIRSIHSQTYPRIQHVNVVGFQQGRHRVFDFSQQLDASPVAGLREGSLRLR